MRWLLLGLLAACGDNRAVSTFWIAPDGSDANVGNVERPFATLERARDAAREVMRETDAAGVIVYLRGGRYELAQTVYFDTQDHDLTFAAAPGEHPILSGGRIVTGWTPAGENFVAPVDLGDFRQLWIDGALAPRARGVVPPGLVLAGDFDRIDGVAGYSAPAFPAFADPSALEFGYTLTWSHKLCGVAAVRGSQIDMDQPCFYLATHELGSPVELPTYIENALELVDEPNEWYFDRTAKLVHVRADVRTAEVIVPALERLIEVRDAENLRFEGITFADASWLRPSMYGHPDVQAGFVMDARDPSTLVPYGDTGLVINLYWAYWKTPGAIAVTGSRDITFHRCTFTRLGGAGLDVERAARGTTIRGNRFVDIAASAVQIGDVLPDDHHPPSPDQILRDTRVTDNVIQRAGLQYEDSVGIFVGYTANTVVAHNDISDLPYSGISMGWGWGDLDAGGNPLHTVPWRYDTPTSSRDNRIANNAIYDVMKRRVDGGGVYTTGALPGTVIANNHVRRSIGWFGGVYLDQGSAHIEVVGNSVFDVPDPYYTDNVAPDTLATNHEHDNFFGEDVDVGAGLTTEYRDLLD